MTARTEILDQPERLRGAFWGSVVLHAGMVGVFTGLTVLHPFGNGPIIQLGDPKGGGYGSVAVNSVPSIPLPNRGGLTNPVANDTESKVPQAPSKVKPQPKAKTPEPNAIPLKGRTSQERKQAAAPNKWADQQQYRPNQLYSTSGAAASSPLYNVPGGGGIGIGTNSPFGTAFGWYGNLLRQKIAGAWRASELGARNARPVTIQFTMRRDGSLIPGLPRIAESSGDAAVDRSAQRAILDAVPFPPLPDGLGRNEVTVELTFHLRQ